MRKKEELSDPNSCLNKAMPDELLFVLLARDPVAPLIVRLWCEARVARGLNKWNDDQIVEARRWASNASLERENQDFKTALEAYREKILQMGPEAMRQQMQNDPPQPGMCRECAEHGIDEPVLVGNVCYDHAKACDKCGQPMDPQTPHTCKPTGPGIYEQTR